MELFSYISGERIYAKVNSLTSIETELPYSYYNLPYCHPQGGIKRSAENLGELLMGDQIDNSPYRFHVNVNESLYLCTTNALNEHEVKLLKQRTHDLYQEKISFTYEVVFVKSDIRWPSRWDAYLKNNIYEVVLGGLTKTGSDYNVKSAHVELAEKMRKKAGSWQKLLPEDPEHVKEVDDTDKTVFSNLKYSRVEIDEVRFEWAECMLDYI
ncbi:hypothetical protein ZIOFF_050670 [Zingiber officinale]|uniref:Transmembrane 9 superfamily member n=1 Tax=Zingiber officinale TaxID=94328 RepID=A0A8J5FRY8_ZINOF|nr:hypothetical protein ZIOFF_050670 [Zingiber officinale]